MKSKGFWISIFLLVALVGYLIYWASQPLPDLSNESTTPTKFDLKKWREGRLIEQDNPRVCMLEDLKNNQLKIGMDSLSIKKILGKSESNFGFCYYLGYYQSGFDPSFLMLEFDVQGRLSALKVKTI